MRSWQSATKYHRLPQQLGEETTADDKLAKPERAIRPVVLRCWSVGCCILLLGLVACINYSGDGRSLTRLRWPAAAARATVELQRFVLDVLRPLPPQLLPSDSALLPVTLHGERVYRMKGANYVMSSASSRLQRLPMLPAFWSVDGQDVYRYPHNPSLAPLPALPPTAAHGRFSFLLAVQLGSGYSERIPHERSRYYPGNWSWTVRQVLSHLSIDVTHLDSASYADRQFQLSFSDEQLSPVHRIDSRILAYTNSSIITYDAFSAVLIEQQTAANGSRRLLQQHAPRWLGYGTGGKNYMMLVVAGQLFYVHRFAPFVVVACGLPTSTAACALHVQHNVSGPDWLLPASSDHWSGSTPLIPLPSFPYVYLGLVHDRSSAHSGQPIRSDMYDTRFVLVDVDSWLPLAWTEPFGLFAELNSTDWFEFVMGVAFLGEDEVVLTLGYNDQEPWLAVLPMPGLLPSFRPANANQSQHVEKIRRHYEHFAGDRVLTR